MSSTNSVNVCRSGWTKTRDGEFCTRDVTTSERCRLGEGGRSDSCYGGGGRWDIAGAVAGAKATPVPPASLSLSASCSRLLPLGESTGGEPELIIAIESPKKRSKPFSMNGDQVEAADVRIILLAGMMQMDPATTVHGML